MLHSRFSLAIYFMYAAKLLQLCLTLCDPKDSSPSGFPVPGILQARTLEWVAISFSNAWKWKVKVKSLSRVQLLATPWTLVYQAPPSMSYFHPKHCFCIYTSPAHSHQVINGYIFLGLDFSWPWPTLRIERVGGTKRIFVRVKERERSRRGVKRLEMPKAGGNGARMTHALAGVASWIRSCGISFGGLPSAYLSLRKKSSLPCLEKNVGHKCK